MSDNLEKKTIYFFLFIHKCLLFSSWESLIRSDWSDGPSCDTTQFCCVVILHTPTPQTSSPPGKLYVKSRHQVRSSHLRWSKMVVCSLMAVASFSQIMHPYHTTKIVQEQKKNQKKKLSVKSPTDRKTRHCL